MSILDPLALSVARRYLALLQNRDPAATAALPHGAAIERVAREYQRRGEGLVPVGGDDGDEDDDGQAGAARGE